MDLTHLVRIARRRAWIPLLFFAVATLASGVLVLRSNPLYTATATVLAKNPETGTDRPLNFPDVLSSNTVALRALKDAHVSGRVAELEKELSVVAGRSDIYRVSVTDPDPALAVGLANAIAQEGAAFYQELASGVSKSIENQAEKDQAAQHDRYLALAKNLLEFDRKHPDVAAGRSTDSQLGAERLALQLDQQAAANAYLNLQTGLSQALIGRINVARTFEAEVIDSAVARADTGSRPFKVAYAGALGLVLGICLVVLLEYVGRSSPTPEQVEELLGAPVVGVIPHGDARRRRRVLKVS